MFRATNFLTGYNMKSDEERMQFDEIQMCVLYEKRMIVTDEDRIQR